MRCVGVCAGGLARTVHASADTAQARTGGQRRVRKAAPKAAGSDDKRLQTTLKRLNTNNIPGIEEVRAAAAGHKCSALPTSSPGTFGSACAPCGSHCTAGGVPPPLCRPTSSRLMATSCTSSAPRVSGAACHPACAERWPAQPRARRRPIRLACQPPSCPCPLPSRVTVQAAFPANTYVVTGTPQTKCAWGWERNMRRALLETLLC